MALAMLAKPNSAVFLVGLGLLYMLAALRQKKLRPLAGLALALALCLAASEAMLLCMEAVSGYDLHSGEPFAAWVAMGLQEGPLGPGWFNQYNDILYVLHQGDGAAITAEAAEMIKARCLVFLRQPSYAAHFFGLKTLTQWCEPTYAVFWTDRSALLESLPAAVRAFYAGPVHHAAVYAADVVQALTYAGAALALWLRRRSQRRGAHSRCHRVRRASVPTPSGRQKALLELLHYDDPLCCCRPSCRIFRPLHAAGNMAKPRPTAAQNAYNYIFEKVVGLSNILDSELMTEKAS